MNNKDNVIKVIKYFGDIFAKHLDLADESILVTLHEKNGIYLGGFSTRLDVLKKIESIDFTPNPITRYLDDLEKVELGIWKNDMMKVLIIINFKESEYYISVINKSYSYLDFPTLEELHILKNKIVL